ncbi:MAG: IS21-like element helper ATPase IstB [Campylobacterota bacterium]|nr:IS21-like element helper ATPase IstB [Campylobacterota bacterium]
MDQTTVINKINDLDFKGLKEAYLRQLEDVNYHSLSFEDRLYNLLDAQYIFLQNKRIDRNSKASKIKDKQALVEQIDYSARRKLDKTNMLSLITMDFIRAKQNIIITGKTGTGKSYLAQALGNRAIIDGFQVYYIRMATLLEDIKLARIDGSYTKLINKYSRYKLLIIDDFGVTPISSDDTTNLFEIIELRSELSSTIITSQLPVRDWYGYLNNNTAADAILDRISNTSHRIELEGESMRKIKSDFI